MKLEPSSQTKWKTRPLQTSSLQSQAFPVIFIMLVGSQTRIVLYQVHIVLRQDDAIVRVMIIHGYGF